MEHDHDRPEFGEPFWDTFYQAQPQVWSGNPNPQLVREAAGLTPGHALDLGCGEGSDAIWLAERGWTVTAMDISSTALERAAAHAAGRDVADRIAWLHQDLDTWHPEERFDLISAQFLHHLPREPRRRMFGVCAEAVAPGGTLLIVGHQPDALHAGFPPDLYYTPDQLAEDLALAPESWVMEVLESRTRAAVGPDGHDITLTDTVLRATRRA